MFSPIPIPTEPAEPAEPADSVDSADSAKSTSMEGQGDAGGWPSTNDGQPSGGGRSNNN